MQAMKACSSIPRDRLGELLEAFAGAFTAAGDLTAAAALRERFGDRDAEALRRRLPFSDCDWLGPSESSPDSSAYQ